MLKDYFLLAFGNLRHRKLRSWLTMIGIFIGIAAVVALIGLGEGLRSAITGQFGALGPDLLAVQASGLNFAGPPGTTVAKPITKDLRDKIQKIQGVEAAINRYIQTGTFEFNNIQEIIFAWNVPNGKDRGTFQRMLNLEVESGRLLKDGDKFKVVLGHDFADSDTYGKSIEVGNKIKFSGKQFEVVGILAKKGSFIFDTAVIMNEDVLFDNFRKDDSVNVIAVKVKDIKTVDSVKRDIENLLRRERNVREGEEDFTVQSSQSSLESLNSALFGVQLFVIIIAFISIIVGAIGITNTMYTAVLERTKEIGIMKSIGARNSGIFALFFFESGFLGLVGGLVGVAIGVGLANLFAYAGRQALGSDLIKTQISLFLMVGSLVFSFVIGLVAGLIPAIQASRKHPVDSLRFVK